MSGGVRGRKFLNVRNFLLLDCHRAAAFFPKGLFFLSAELMGFNILKNENCILTSFHIGGIIYNRMLMNDAGRVDIKRCNLKTDGCRMENEKRQES